MELPGDAPVPSPWRPRLLFAISAAAAALVLRLAWEEPLVGVAALAVIATVVVSRWLARLRARRLLRSGDIEAILQRWTESFGRAPHPETMQPLMRATAFAAYGWVEQARDLLRMAARGPAWDAALEHRLFLDSLLLTFEGESEAALDQARALQRMPLPMAAPLLVNRVRVLRDAVAALARAFSHQSEDGDRRLLLEASDTSPLVHWAMRYGAAVLAVDAGELGRARALLVDAPAWPGESCFANFHREITDEVARREGGDTRGGDESAE
ncbi:MAG: hypothetical protein JRI68_14985 [Deltaproteobacteria bacterium]|nr:hypothetical protein [Deltaproteobacteria bacterium]